MNPTTWIDVADHLIDVLKRQLECAEGGIGYLMLACTLQIFAFVACYMAGGVR